MRTEEHRLVNRADALGRMGVICNRRVGSDTDGQSEGISQMAQAASANRQPCQEPIVQRSGNRCRWWLIRHGGFARLGRLGGYARLLWITRNAGGAPAIVVDVRGIAVRLSVHIVLHCIRPRLRASAVEARAGYFYPTFRRPKHLPRCLTTSGRQEPGTRRTDRRHPALRCEC